MQATEPSLVHESADSEAWRAGGFTFFAEGAGVIVTKDTPRGILSVNVYTYKTNEQACDAAYKMARRQMRA